MLKRQSKPWMNSHIKKLMNYRDILFNTMIKTPSPSNRYLYKTFRNRVVSEQRREKIRYFQNYFETHKTNIKMLWTGIKSLVSTKSKNQFSQISHLLDNGKRIDDPVKMANIFDHYFVNVGSALTNQFLELGNHPWIT